MLGALGNLGVNPDHAVKIITAYLTDTDANVRAGAAEALALAATDETIPTLLDRFRNDPSPVVQERAACGLAEAGMYTQAQRISFAGTLVDWLDDSRLSPQQRMWTLQALRDISRQNFGTNSAAWHKWYEGVAPN
jgi:HEAT repeat protein